MNWIDLAIILYISYFFVIAYFHGFIRTSIELVGLIGSFLFASKFYGFFEGFIPAHFPIDSGAMGFIVAWLISILVYSLLFSIFLFGRIPTRYKDSRYNHYAGPLPGLIKGVIYGSILITLISILPLSSQMRSDIETSVLGRMMVKQTTKLESRLEKIFSGAINQTLTFLTIKEPKSNESIDLGFSTNNVKTDEVSEQKMLDLVNKERTSRGLKPLVMDKELLELARSHSRDMFAKGYFSHVNKEGKSPFDRMNDRKIIYLIAGENLALAPNVDIAHNGLMNSPGHRANILTAEFGKAGIGVMDGGVYGKMFSQEFTD